MVVREGFLKEGKHLDERETQCVPGKGPFQPWAAGNILIPLIPTGRLVVKCGLSWLAISTLPPSPSPHGTEAWACTFLR